MSIDKSTSNFLSCDWGTSTFRLKLADSRCGEVLNCVTSSIGIKNITRNKAKGGWTSGTSNPFQNYLKSQIAFMEKRFSVNLDSVPIVISGMASSSIGWKELSYGSLPFSLTEPDLPVRHIPSTNDFPYEVYLISGLSSSDDIMRGEETQVVGLAARYYIEEGLCLLPGTHCKHIQLENNAITHFETYLTGELFELLSTHSILQNSVHAPKDQFNKDSFIEGVGKAKQSNLLHDLFSIRARDLLQFSNPEKNYDFLSGLLIGSELRDLKEPSNGKIYLTGNERLQIRYAKALDFLDLDYQPITPGTELTVHGHCMIYHKFKHKPRKT